MRIVLVLVGISALCGCGVVNQSSVGKAGDTAAPEVFEGPVPKAACGPADLSELGLQGRVSLADKVTGRSMTGYNCNLERVGHYPGDGANWQMAWYEDCAYYDTSKLVPGGSLGAGVPNAVNRQMPARPGMQHPGTVVLDVSDPANPVATTWLESRAMLDPWESLKVNEQRKLMAGDENNGPAFDVYDLSGDCRDPKLAASVDLAGVIGHAGDFTPDGLTYYITFLPDGIIYPVDISDAAEPKLMLSWNAADVGRIHDLSFNAAGTRSYLAGSDGNGLIIIDTSDVQARRPEPQISVLSQLFWPDGATAQQTLPVFYGDRAYVLFVDEGGHGAARFIDISDEKNPFIVSKLKLEIHMPENANTATQDTADVLPGLGGFGYEGHYCNVDRVQDPTLAACSYFQSGLRVFDVRDPYHPREIAYYNPPAKPGYTAGSNYNRSGIGGFADWTTAIPRFVLDRNEIWFTSQEAGFQVVRFTNGILPLK